MTENTDRAILHCDVNNFFASVEMVLNEDLRDKHIAVCGNPELRHGIVLAKSNKAKAMGVKTGDTVNEALKKCPELIIVPPHHDEYVKFSQTIFDIYYSFSPNVESFGLDECWLDITGTQNLFGTPEETAHKIKEKVKSVTGLTISVGVSFTKVFAKLGSDLKKPDAVTVITRDNYKTIVWKLKVSELLFIGKQTAISLEKINIKTIGDLANTSIESLTKRFGKLGEKLHNFSNGIETEVVKEYGDINIPKSVGNGTTTPKDITNFFDAKRVIFSLCEVIAYRLRKINMMATGVSINLRDTNLNHITKQSQLFYPTSSCQEIAQCACDMLAKIYTFVVPLRTITVSTYHLVNSNSYVQFSIFAEDNSKLLNLDKALDDIREKYGYSSLKNAITIDTIFTCDSKEIDDNFVPFGGSKPNNP